MKKISLNGQWLFRQADSAEWLKATVPGDNFSDLLAANKIPDPYVGLNESKVQWVGDADWIYTKHFTLAPSYLAYDAIELTFEMLDSLCEIRINGVTLASCNNANIAYTFDVKHLLQEGDNTIEIVFFSPVRYISDKQAAQPLPPSYNGLDGAPYLRKPQCHFGWDWGPTIPLCGMPREVYLCAYNVAKIADLTIAQRHEKHVVTLRVDAEVAAVSNAVDSEQYHICYELTAPDGTKKQLTSSLAQPNAEFVIDNPQLWWPNGMSEAKTQPLYTLNVFLRCGSEAMHGITKRIGLRTLELDTSPDEYGKQFCFKVNGVPIFARGANWIPADSLVARVTHQRNKYLLGAVRDGNMNMLRVWGGGYYESDDFYDLCDQYGILVWQDFAYACAPYPFCDEEFLANCNAEAIYNIHRLRHHASLALWCGNNELESCSQDWKKEKELLRWTEKYFWHILPQIVSEHDKFTPYIAGSPVGSSFMKDYTSDNEGDTHLWAVWHGFKPLTYYRKRFTRFCSEFGMESLPDMKTIEYFANKQDYSMNSPVFMAHQKCKSGNNKILAYITSRFALPKGLEDIAYLSGIIQGECVKDATEHWRRNRGRCNGSLYWQLNDCWPVNSWAGMDYFGRYKPLQYFAKRFDAPQTVSAYKEGDDVFIYGINDRTEEFPCTIRYTLETFNGVRLDSGEFNVVMPAVSSTKFKTFNYKKLVKLHKKQVVFCVEMYDATGKKLADECVLFAPEKKLKLPDAHIAASFSFADDVAYVTLRADAFARYVHLDVANTYKPFSDNFFDLTANKSVTVSFPLDGISPEEFAKSFSVSSLCNVKNVHSRLHDYLLSWRIRLIPVNIANYIAYK